MNGELIDQVVAEVTDVEPICTSSKYNLTVPVKEEPSVPVALVLPDV